MKRELIFSVTRKDFEITYFSGTGAGGQHRNRHMNCVRVRHLESGAEGKGTESRKTPDNLRKAFKRCVESDKFKNWHRIKTSEILSKKNNEITIEEAVKKEMSQDSLITEVFRNGEWVKLT